MTARDILEIIENSGCAYFGIRVDDGVYYDVGDYLADSREWYDNELTGNTMNGTCCIGISNWPTVDEIEDKLEYAKEKYFGDNMYLIGGFGVEYGDDPYESIIKNAKVLAVIQ